MHRLLSTNLEQENIELALLLQVKKELRNNFSSQKIITAVFSVFKNIFDIRALEIFAYDETTETIRNLSKEWLVIENKEDVERINSVFSSFEKDSEDGFILNNNLFTLDGNFDSKKVEPLISEDVNCWIFPLKNQNGLLGFIQIEAYSLFEKFINKNFFLSVCFVADYIAQIITNIRLNEKMTASINFYQSMKDIAKIIETQYEFNFIIPLIGEMIDKFIPDHLIYIFAFDENKKFNLLWPSAYSSGKIDKYLDVLKTKKTKIITDDKLTGIFPLISENNLIGAIVSLGTINKLSNKQIDELEQLSNQASITIDKANTYAEILKNATLDALTGLNNRSQFDKQIQMVVSVARRKNVNLSYIMMDIDYFKKVNDTYGHAVGDVVLKVVAKTISEQLRPYDMAFRYGGEEFAIILPATPINEAKVVAERVRQSIEDTVIDISEFNNKSVKEISVTVSLGLCKYKKGDTPNDMHQRADAALYMAKDKGRNQVVLDEA